MYEIDPLFAYVYVVLILLLNLSIVKHPVDATALDHLKIVASKAADVADKTESGK